MSVIHIDRNNFQSEVLDSDRPVLLDFWAPWCTPCRMVGPILDEIAGERSDIKVAKVNVDEQPELAGQFGVMSIPTVIFLKDGKEIDSESLGSSTYDTENGYVFIDANNDPRAKYGDDVVIPDETAPKNDDSSSSSSSSQSSYSEPSYSSSSSSSHSSNRPSSSSSSHSSSSHSSSSQSSSESKTEPQPKPDPEPTPTEPESGEE